MSTRHIASVLLLGGLLGGSVATRSAPTQLVPSSRPPRQIQVDTTPWLRIPIAPLAEWPHRGLVTPDHGILLIIDNGRGMIAFDATGAERWSQRITPAGGGAFEWYSDLLRGPDGSALLWDALRDRLTTLNDAGQPRSAFRSTPLPRIKLPSGGRSPQPLMLHGRLTTGELVASNRADRSAEAFIRHDSIGMYRIDSRGRTAPIGRVLQRVRFSRGEPYLVQGTVPFGRTGRIAVTGTSWYYTDGSAFTIERRDARGALTGRFGAAHARRPVDGDAVRRSRLDMLAAVDSILKGSLVRALAAMPYPDSMPAYTDLLADAAGVVWAEVGAPAWEPHTWDLFAARGTPLGEVTLPAYVRVLDISHDALLAVHEVPGGATTLQLHRVGRQ